MTWEESHPSLKGEYNYAQTFPKDFYVVPMLVVSQTQLDKQRVREAISKCIRDTPSDCCDMFADDLRDVLGL
jgi:predicted class III extradiol MEMO1 family dioxygenase